MSKESHIDVPESIRPYLNEIADRLWSNRAAVMVGAGFSKNAGDGFPDWNQLGDLFFQKARGEKPDSTQKKYLNVLRLADEVEAAFGRPALDNLLRDNIPDLTIEPSDLHVQILELPWVDVFTTNYDTLLERASAKVVTRRYRPVVNTEDIPYADKPRIVKLHGSFPSERPFVITEEDYRRYPYDNAPFVNTVQQSLLENTLCLVGFSGDDPNFLQWLGWIRDNLGRDKMQKIYLLGAFDLSSAKIQLLVKRGITVVNMSCCSGIDKHDHKQALKKFLDFMETKEPKLPGWPETTQKMMSPPQAADRIEAVKKITEEWRKQRQDYPGWLILPNSNRERLWKYTQDWVNYSLGMDQFPPGLDIQYTFELIWRLERCLLPLFSEVATICEVILERYYPFDKDNPSKNRLSRAGAEVVCNLPWKEIKEAWIALALAMLRFYREEGLLEKWKEAEKRLKAISDQFSVEQQEFLNYEGVLFCLFTLDLPNVKERLENWLPNQSHPYWMVKRAALLAEIGLVNQAEILVRGALERIRKSTNSKKGRPDLSMFSQESNAMLLGEYIQNAAAFQRNNLGEFQDKNKQFQDRWSKLKGYKCDPWGELKLFELALSAPPIQRKSISEKHEFDVGRITRTFSTGGIDQELFNAYSFLRFCEDAGIPFHLGNYTFATKTAMGCLQRISRSSSFWAAATLARLGDTKAADELFNRESIYKFTDKEADQLIQSYLETLDNCRDDIRTGDVFRNNNFGTRLARLLPEVISRLCCKCSSDMKGKLLSFLAEIYASPDKGKYGNVKSLVRRLLSSMSETEQYNHIPDLLKIPVPEGLHNPIIRDEFRNPFLLFNLNQKPAFAVKRIDIQPEFIEKLLYETGLEDTERRRWALSSLIQLHKMELLDAGQSKRLASDLWRVTDQYGLPEGTDFYKFVFLSLPHPEGVDLAKLFRNYVTAASFPVQKDKQKGGIAITGGSIPLATEILGANSSEEIFWTREDAVEILQKLLVWWDADKSMLDKEERGPAWFGSIPEEFRARFASIASLLAEVVGPKLSPDSPAEIKDSLSRLFEEMRKHSLHTLEAEAACLHLFPERKFDVFDRIKSSLISNIEDREKDGLEAISRIVFGNMDADDGSVEPDPLLMLSQYLTWHFGHSTSRAMSIVVRILKKTSGQFYAKQQMCVLEEAAQHQLGRLLGETSYDKDDSVLTFEKKVEMRRSAATLAATLQARYGARGLPVPGIVEEWRKRCFSPREFSEVTSAWMN